MAQLIFGLLQFLCLRGDEVSHPLVELALLLEDLDLVKQRGCPVLVVVQVMLRLSHLLQALLVHFDFLLIGAELEDAVVGSLELLGQLSNVTLQAELLRFLILLHLS